MRALIGEFRQALLEKKYNSDNEFTFNMVRDGKIYRTLNYKFVECFGHRINTLESEYSSTIEISGMLAVELYENGSTDPYFHHIEDMLKTLTTFIMGTDVLFEIVGKPDTSLRTKKPTEQEARMYLYLFFNRIMKNSDSVYHYDKKEFYEIIRNK